MFDKDMVKNKAKFAFKLCAARDKTFLKNWHRARERERERENMRGRRLRSTNNEILLCICC